MELAAIQVVDISMDHPYSEFQVERNPDQFEAEEYKVDGQLLKIQNNAFHLKYPIVVGQKG